MAKILLVSSREILASGAFPTLETTVVFQSGATGTASVPYGASAGSREASILLDGDPKRYLGRGCLKAIRNVEKVIFSALKGKEVSNQYELDALLHELDSSPRKEKLGGNAILSVSLAAARAFAFEKKKSLSAYLGEYIPHASRAKLPQPMMVVIEGGQHADNSTDFQEYLICILKRGKLCESVRIGIEVFHHVKKILKRRGYNTNVGTEGAFAPAGIKSNEEPIEILLEAIKSAGYKPGVDVGIGVDVAASEFYDGTKYVLRCEEREMNAKELIARYAKLVKKYPALILVEDGLHEDDWESWSLLYKALGPKTLVVGDDLTVSQKAFLQRAIELKAINAIIIKPNQAGTLTEALDTINLAYERRIRTIVSHRGGGDTNDTFIMDLAAAAGSLYTKVGPSRGERVEKYNRMMQIEEER